MHIRGRLHASMPKKRGSGRSDPAGKDRGYKGLVPVCVGAMGKEVSSREFPFRKANWEGKRTRKPAFGPYTAARAYARPPNRNLFGLSATETKYLHPLLKVLSSLAIMSVQITATFVETYIGSFK